MALPCLLAAAGRDAPAHARPALPVLGNYLAANGPEQLLTSPADISWGTGTLVQPDLFIGGDQAPLLPGTAHSRPI